MNKVVLAGRVTKDIEVRYTDKGKDSLAVAHFTLAVNRQSKDADADFISCVAFGGLAETLEQYVFKGDQIIISGCLRTGSYEDKDGITHYTTEVLIDTMDFGAKKQEKEEKPKKVNSRR